VDQKCYQSYHLSDFHRTIEEDPQEAEDFPEDSPEAEDSPEEEGSPEEEDTQEEVEYHPEDHPEEAGDLHQFRFIKLNKEN